MKGGLVVFFVLAAVLRAEDVNVRMARILRAFDQREEADDSTREHAEWLKTEEGAADVAFLAEHLELLKEDYKSDVPTVLARSGLLVTVPLLTNALAVSDDAIAGIYYACDGGGLDPEFGRAVAPAVAAWAGKSVIESRDIAIEVLPLVDSKLAAATFFTPEFTGLQAPRVHYVLGSCNRGGLLVPRSVIDPLLEAWEKPAQNSQTESRIQKGYVESVIALAAHDATAALRRAEVFVKAAPYRSDDLSDIPLLAAGLQDLDEAVAKVAEDRRKFDALPEAARMYYASVRFYAEEDSGGFGQAFSKSAGDDFPLVRKASEVIGDTDGLGWLEWACKPFGKDGPSPVLAERIRQMNDMKPSYVDGESEHMGVWEEKQRELKQAHRHFKVMAAERVCGTACRGNQTGLVPRQAVTRPF